MAAEDGAVLGKLLGLLSTSDLFDGGNKKLVPHVLKLYESLRKDRTTLNVQGAVANQYAFHLPDGPLQEHRDAWLLSLPNSSPSSDYRFADEEYLRAMLAFDPVADCVQAFRQWETAYSQGTLEKL